MELRRLTQGERIAAVSAALLLAFTFLDWYGVTVSVYGVSVSHSGNAWNMLDVIPILLVVGIVATFGLIALKASGADRELVIDGAQMIAALGAASFLLILYRILDRPMIGSGPGSVEASTQIGIFLALIAAAGMAFGGWRAMQEDDFWMGTVGEGPTSEHGGQGEPGSPSSVTSGRPASSAPPRPPSAKG